MKVDQKIARLICELEYQIGSQCYNSDSYNGYTDEYGASFRYPVMYNGDKKTRMNVVEALTFNKDTVQPGIVDTLKYRMGANELYVGIGIQKLLEELEKRYGLDFNALENGRAD